MHIAQGLKRMRMVRVRPRKEGTAKSTARDTQASYPYGRQATPQYLSLLPAT